MRGRVGQDDDPIIDDEATTLVLETLFELRLNVRRLVTELLDEEDDGPGEEEEEA